MLEQIIFSYRPKVIIEAELSITSYSNFTTKSQSTFSSINY